MNAVHRAEELLAERPSPFVTQAPAAGAATAAAAAAHSWGGGGGEPPLMAGAFSVAFTLHAAPTHLTLLPEEVDSLQAAEQQVGWAAWVSEAGRLLHLAIPLAVSGAAAVPHMCWKQFWSS